VDVAIFVEAIAQSRCKVICARCGIGYFIQHLAIEIREWLPHHDGNDNQSNQEKRVDACADQKRKDAVEIEDEGDGTIQHGNAYDAQNCNKDWWGSGTSADHFGNEIGRDTNNSDHGSHLEGSGRFEGRPENTVIRTHV